MENNIIKLTEFGFNLMFTDMFWKKGRFKQCILITLYACYLSGQDDFCFELIKNMIDKRNLNGLTDQEFKRLCDELKDNKEACKNFVNMGFN
jgi:hypothetical protein